MDKSKLLDQCGALGDDRLLLARVLDRARQASERNVPAATDFLSPAQQAMAMDMLRTAGISDTAYVRLGGYDDAERARSCFCRTGWTPRTPKVKVPSAVCGRSSGRMKS